MRLGLFGGTFDPPHIGHLLAAVDAFEALELDRLVFVPAGVQPFKGSTVRASNSDRIAMLRLMISADSRFEVDRIELDRPGLSYTVDTLQSFAMRYPGASLFLLIGQDLAGQIEEWRDPAGIASAATIVVLARETAPDDRGAALPLRRLSSRRVDVSSTEIRERVRAGRSIRGFVTEAVAEHIVSAGLYR